jgi:putative endonuclease
MARRAEPLQPSKPRPRPERVAAFQRGLSAESRAALLLIAKAYRILERRWKTPFGEIDIVARRRGAVVFVEVKARRSIDEAVEAVTKRTKRRVIGAAEMWRAPSSICQWRYPLRRHRGDARQNAASHRQRFHRRGHMSGSASYAPGRQLALGARWPLTR